MYVSNHSRSTKAPRINTTGRAPLKDKIRKIIKDHARLAIDVSALDDTADLGQAGMTSHANVMLMLALENEFGLEFPDQMLSRRVFESVETIADAIESLQPRGAL
jgi:acyl carrier protein